MFPATPDMTGIKIDLEECSNECLCRDKQSIELYIRNSESTSSTDAATATKVVVGKNVVGVTDRIAKTVIVEFVKKGTNIDEIGIQSQLLYYLNLSKCGDPSLRKTFLILSCQKLRKWIWMVTSSKSEPKQIC